MLNDSALQLELPKLEIPKLSANFFHYQNPGSKSD